MRIAYVCADPGVPVFGRKGCSVHVQEVIRAFRRSGADVELFAARADGPLPPELDGVHVHRLPAVRAAAPGIAAVEGLNRALAVGLSQAAPFDMVYERYSLWSAAAMEHAHAARAAWNLYGRVRGLDETLARRPGPDRSVRGAACASTGDPPAARGRRARAGGDRSRSRAQEAHGRGTPHRQRGATRYPGAPD